MDNDADGFTKRISAANWRVANDNASGFAKRISAATIDVRKRNVSVWQW